MGAKIHLYPLERFIFGDDDYYDIDYFDGLIYQTAKIKGSTIKAGIIAGVDTIYTADGAINGDRTITGTNTNQLLFDQFRQFVFNTNPAPLGTPGFIINGGITGPFLRVNNAVTGDTMLQVSTAGITINEQYTLPLNDGTPGQVMTTNGAGVLSWATSGAGDMLQSQYDPNNTGVVLSAQKLTVEFINKTGATLTKGTIVYLKNTSSSGTHPEALKADATTEATSSKTIGAVFEDTLDNAIGKIVTSGEVDNLNTSIFPIGTKLWLSTTPGQVTATPPTQPNHTVFIGTVTRSQNTNGRILYTIQNGFELNELHNVLITGTPLDGQVLAFNAISQLWENITQNNVTFGQSQWSVTAPSTTLPSGQVANGFSFFTEANKNLSGTTSYDEYFLSWGRNLTLTGTNGTANINILGVNYLVTFNTNLILTASDFVTTHQTTLNALGIQVFANNGVLRFGSLIQSNVTTITITTLTGNLSGTFNTAINDHIVIPYVGRPYFGQRLTHNIRVNFNIDVGNLQYYALSLRRWADDSVIGSIIQISRNTALTGQQQVFASYTAGANDPFVTGGFYFALENQTGQNVTISGNAGILIITEYQKPTKF